MKAPRETAMFISSWT